MTHAPRLQGLHPRRRRPDGEFPPARVQKQLQRGACPGRQCLFPAPCKNLIADHSDYLACCASSAGCRTSWGLHPQRHPLRLPAGRSPSDTFFKELERYHISRPAEGRAGACPTRCCASWASPAQRLPAVRGKYKKINEQEGMKQYVVPPISCPRTRLHDAGGRPVGRDLLRYQPRARAGAGSLPPTPSTLSTVIGDTGPTRGRWSRSISPKNPHEKGHAARAHAVSPAAELFPRARSAAEGGRTDLIGFDPKCLIRPLPAEGEKSPARRTRSLRAALHPQNRPKTPARR